jgi:hypothetical protein
VLSWVRVSADALAQAKTLEGAILPDSTA